MARKKRPVDLTGMSAEERAEHFYREKERVYDEQWAHVNSLKDNDPGHEDELCKLDKLRIEMFRAFDNWQHQIKHKFTADQADVKTLLYDAIMANFDCLPDVEEKEKLEKRWHTLEVVDDLISALKGWGVSVRSTQIGTPPMCGHCAEELAA